jgi:hypothetical protein
MRKFLTLFLFLAIISPVFGQDTIADLDARVTLESTDLLECEDVTPAGSYKCTIGEVLTFICTQGTDTTATCALNTDSVSANELDAAGVEAELEAVLDLQDLQGAVIDAQVPNSITLDGTSQEVALEAVIDLQDLQGAVTDAQVPDTITVDEATAVTDADKGDIDISSDFWDIDANTVGPNEIGANVITEGEVEGGGSLGAGEDGYVWAWDNDTTSMEFVSNAAGAETDPTLTDDQAVTVGDGTGADVVITADSTTDSTITWDLSALTWVFGHPIATPASSLPGVSLTDSDNSNTDVSVKYGADQQDVDNADAVIYVEDGGSLTEKLRITDDSEAVLWTIDTSLCTGGSNSGKLTVSGTTVICDDDVSGGAPATADISDVSVTQTELAELETIGTTVIEAADWTAVAAMSGVNTGDNTTATAAVADTIDAITEIAAALKSGSDGTLITGTSGTTDNCAKWDANGDLVDNGSACGGGGGAPTDATYLTAAAEAGLSAEVVVNDKDSLEAALSDVTELAEADGQSYTGYHDFGAGSIEIENADNPNVSTNGEIAVDSTADQFLYFHGSLYTLDARRFESATVEDPADADNFMLFKAPFALTITDIECIVDPADTGESVVIDIQERNGTGDSPATVDATITCDNDGASDDGTLTNGAIDSGDWVSLDIGTVTGTVNQVSVTITYQVDRV